MAQSNRKSVCGAAILSATNVYRVRRGGNYRQKRMTTAMIRSDVDLRESIDEPVPDFFPVPATAACAWMPSLCLRCGPCAALRQGLA
jgi:hypothetical protein